MRRIEFLGIHEEPYGKVKLLKRPTIHTIAFKGGGFDTMAYEYYREKRRSVGIFGLDTHIPLPSKRKLTR